MAIETTPSTVPDCPRHPEMLSMQAPCERTRTHSPHFHQHDDLVCTWCPGSPARPV